MAKQEKINRSTLIGSKNKRRDLLFVLLLLLWPTLQFCVFYIGVNFNSFLMVFQTHSRVNGVLHTTTSLEAFKNNFEWLKVGLFKSKDFTTMIKMSLLTWGIGVVTATPLGLLFSYYISKKFAGSQFFRTILYMPSIVSGLVLVIIYKSMLNNPIKEIITPKMEDLNLFNAYLLSSKNPLSVRLTFLLLFNIWSSFGSSVLMYSNAMSGIDPEIYESASIDGARGIKEFVHISFPMIWPTFSVFFVNNLATIATNQHNLYAVYGFQPGPNNDMLNFGYYMFREVSSGPSHYAHMALLGLVLSAVVIPVTLIVRKLLEKFGPSTK